jgi:hypothetical protein
MLLTPRGVVVVGARTGPRVRVVMCRRLALRAPSALLVRLSPQFGFEADDDLSYRPLNKLATPAGSGGASTTSTGSDHQTPNPFPSGPSY